MFNLGRTRSLLRREFFGVRKLESTIVFLFLSITFTDNNSPNLSM